ETLTSLHQPTGAQGKVDIIWQFWSKQCIEGASVRQHIGDIQTTHMELAEMGIVIKDYLLAIVMSKSLPPSYDKCVATIFAGIKDLEQADSRYVANKIFEEEMRRENKSEDANIAFPRKYCSNCKKPGHLQSPAQHIGGGKEGHGPRQIARRKKQEAERKIGNKPSRDSVQVVEQDFFNPSHMALEKETPAEYTHLTSYSWSHDSWIADSGASAHIAVRQEMFATFTPSNGVLNVAGGLTATIEGTGVVYMRGLINGKVKDFKLADLLFVTTTRFCLISGQKLDKAGGKVEFGNMKCVL
ncbi:BgTH12-05206, partial [Blumeria graminis f. sp. triticale]